MDPLIKTTPLLQIIAVGAGGFIGTVLRYAISNLTHWLIPRTAFPLGTLCVNLIGCFCIGLLSGIVETRYGMGPYLRLFVFIGILGGFTTFSTFGYETFQLSAGGEYFKAGSNVLLSVAAGLGCVWCGYALGK